jgi:hypothetical protein
MKKIGLTIGIIALISAFATAQDFSVSATYGFKAMASLGETKPPLGGVIRCGNGRQETLLKESTKFQLSTKSIMATYSPNERWRLALGYQECMKGYPYFDSDSNTKLETSIAYRGIILGFQYNFLRNKHLNCHLNSYWTPELRRFFNGITQELAKDVSVSYVGGVGIDFKILGSFYWTTNVFGETALMRYKLDETGDFTFFPVAFGINSGLQVKF